jgi:hypothetical protein
MTTLLYPNFLIDPREYEQAEALWQERWKELADKVRPAEQWQSPWLTTAFADGTPFRDGNPIFSALCPARRLGIRVIQVEASDGEEELAFWTDTFAEGGSNAVKELVVSCVLTSKTLRGALELMGQWITQENINGRPTGDPQPEQDEPQSRSAGTAVRGEDAAAGGAES